jgi:hypothetical protein
MLKILIVIVVLFVFLGGSVPLSFAQSETSVEHSFTVQNNYSLPEEYRTLITPTPPTVMDQVKDLINKVTALFGFTPFSKEQFTAAVDARKSALIDDELKDVTPPADIIEETARAAGQDSGTLSVTLPEEVANGKDTTCQSATMLDKGFFPDELKFVSTDCK